MSERYYSDSDNYPYVAKAIVERLLLFFGELIYPEESTTDARKRIILANFEDDQNSIKKSIDKFNTSNGKFPCTFYNIDDSEYLDYKTHYQMSGSYYSEILDSYVSYIPITFSIPMVTIFTTPSDYWRAMTYFTLEDSNLTRLDVPISLNNTLTSFPVDLAYSISKGGMAFDVEQQFGYGKLYPIIHSINVKGAYIVLNLAKNETSGITTDSKIVYYVDDILVKLSQLSNEDNLDQNNLEDSAYVPDTPAVSESSPESGDTDVAVDTDIVITFNSVMDETSVLANLDIVPYFDRDITFDDYNKIMTISPRDDLESATSYTILIGEDTESGDSIPMEEDFELEFTTI